MLPKGTTVSFLGWLFDYHTSVGVSVVLSAVLSFVHPQPSKSWLIYLYLSQETRTQNSKVILTAQVGQVS